MNTEADEAAEGGRGHSPACPASAGSQARCCHSLCPWQPSCSQACQARAPGDCHLPECAPFPLGSPLLGRVSGEQEAAAIPLPTCVWLLLTLYVAGSLARWWCQAMGSPLARACLVHSPLLLAPCSRSMSPSQLLPTAHPFLWLPTGPQAEGHMTDSLRRASGLQRVCCVFWASGGKGGAVGWSSCLLL